MNSNQMKSCPFMHSSIVDTGGFGAQQLINHATQIGALVKKANFMKSRKIFFITNIGIRSVTDQNRNSSEKMLVMMSPTQTMQSSTIFNRACVKTGPMKNE